MFNAPHRRYNPLIGEWVLVSPHRAKRPWQGQVEKTLPPVIETFDPTCYLCPGNERAGGISNPAYTSTYAFDNDFASLLLDTDNSERVEDGLLLAEPELGTCRVICFSPRHDLTLPELPAEDAVGVINTWAEETARLGAMEQINYVQVFENKGAMMGCSNPHPHSQIWATQHIPNEPAKELRSQSEYYAKNGRRLLADYLKQELASGERVLFTNDSFTALIPFWAVWPFESIVIAHDAVSDLPSLNAGQRKDLAGIFQQVTTAYDNLFEVSFPYSMGFHQAPSDGLEHPEWTLHAHFFPPLLRSATVRKVMVGYELIAQPQRDITPELAAERLRGLGRVHYRRAG